MRQVGAVLGIAALVALLDAAPASDPVSGFLDAYTLMAAGGTIAATFGLALGRVRTLDASGSPVEAPA